jgi:GNAT superfamily N-acetyltransferase
MSEFVERSPASDEEWERYYDLRWRVLREPWAQPRGSERDNLEADSFHAALWDQTGAPAAVGRLHLNSPAQAQVRYMAVDPKAARRGLGSRILAALEARAAELGATEIVLNARTEAQPFYVRHRYRVVGPAETMFGVILHDRMAKSISGSAALVR